MLRGLEIDHNYFSSYDELDNVPGDDSICEINSTDDEDSKIVRISFKIVTSLDIVSDSTV